MKIIRRMLLGSFWIVLVGSLKVALFTYALFLPNTAIASSGCKSSENATSDKLEAFGSSTAMSGGREEPKETWRMTST